MTTLADLRIGWGFDRPFPELAAGIVCAEGLTTGPSDPALTAALQPHLTAPDPSEATRQSIRQLLRRGGFKPTGRNKPASEYLVEARRRGEWPAILNLVDIINALSLAYGWPISVLDLDRALALPGAASTETPPLEFAEGLAKPGYPPLEMRWGRPDESYVFNASGHVIDLEGLLAIGRTGGVLAGNPVKDAMHTKLVPGSTRTVTVFWASLQAASQADVRAVCATYAELLRLHCGASDTRCDVLTQPIAP